MTRPWDYLIEGWTATASEADDIQIDIGRVYDGDGNEDDEDRVNPEYLRNPPAPRGRQDNPALQEVAVFIGDDCYFAVWHSSSPPPTRAEIKDIAVMLGRSYRLRIIPQSPRHVQAYLASIPQRTVQHTRLINVMGSNLLNASTTGRLYKIQK